MAVSNAIALMAIKTSMNPREGLARVLNRAGNALHAAKPAGMFSRLGTRADELSEIGINRLQNSANFVADKVGRVPIGIPNDLAPVSVPFNALEELPFAEDLNTFRSKLMRRLGLAKKPTPPVSVSLRSRIADQLRNNPEDLLDVEGYLD
jgi:hypothetical protein